MPNSVSPVVYDPNDHDRSSYGLCRLCQKTIETQDDHSYSCSIEKIQGRSIQALTGTPHKDVICVISCGALSDPAYQSRLGEERVRRIMSTAFEKFPD